MTHYCVADKSKWISGIALIVSLCCEKNGPLIDGIMAGRMTDR